MHIDIYSDVANISQKEKSGISKVSAEIYFQKFIDIVFIFTFTSLATTKHTEKYLHSDVYHESECLVVYLLFIDIL